MIIPSDLNDIQPRDTQVWNCDEVGFDINRRWSKVICTYNLFQGERMWKVQTEERSPLWCTLIVSTRSDGKCFMSPIIVHQDKDYSQYMYYNVPLDWIVHHTPSGYMDKDMWIKSMTQFSNVCSSSLVNDKILLFDEHNIHFDDGVLRKMMCKNIQPFVLKLGNSINKQPNNNGTNSKLKSLYYVRKSACMLKYGTKKISPHHVNSSWLTHGMTSRCQLATSWGAYFQKQSYPPSTLLN